MVISIANFRFSILNSVSLRLRRMPEHGERHRPVTGPEWLPSVRQAARRGNLFRLVELRERILEHRKDHVNLILLQAVEKEPHFGIASQNVETLALDRLGDFPVASQR